MLKKEILANNIKAYRTMMGLSQQELAEKIFVSFQALSKWERGLCLPDLDKLCLLSDVFCISLDELVGNKVSNKKVMLGIDGGGSKTEFVLFDEDGELLGYQKLGACNPNAVGIEKSVAVLSEGIEMILDDTYMLEGMYIGASGFLTGSNGEKIQRLLKKKYPHVKIRCASDIMNVIATVTDDENCIAVICGTGSVAFVKEKETLTRLTGWGYLFSGAGSGFDIGRDAVMAALEDIEGLGEKTQLTKLIELRMDSPVNRAIERFYENDQSYIASFAPLVFEAFSQKDKVAAAILKRNAAEMAKVINAAVMQQEHNGKIILSGSLLTENQVFLNMVKEGLMPNLNVILSELPQVYGACKLCAKLCKVDSIEWKEFYERNKDAVLREVYAEH